MLLYANENEDKHVYKHMCVHKILIYICCRYSHRQCHYFSPYSSPFSLSFQSLFLKITHTQPHTHTAKSLVGWVPYSTAIKPAFRKSNRAEMNYQCLNIHKYLGKIRLWAKMPLKNTNPRHINVTKNKLASFILLYTIFFSVLYTNGFSGFWDTLSLS